MANKNKIEVSPTDLREWLRQEVRGLTKAVELRIQDATDFVSAYSSGELSEEQAMERLSTYQSRWGDSPIAGVSIVDGMTNQQILKRLDGAMPHVEPRTPRTRVEEKTGRNPDR